jgi:hypothetical protein
MTATATHAPARAIPARPIPSPSSYRPSTLDAGRTCRSKHRHRPPPATGVQASEDHLLAVFRDPDAVLGLTLIRNSPPLLVETVPPEEMWCR